MTKKRRIGAIPDTLRELVVPLDSLTPYARNPRRGDVETLKQSLRVHGQYRPLVVNRRTSEVLAGNHTWRAARELGWTELAVTYVDVDDDTAARIVLVDNRSSDLAVYDDVELTSLLSSLDDLDGTAWTPDELDVLLAEFGPVAALADSPAALDDEPQPRSSTYTFDVFDADAIVATAMRYFRETGFPYRRLPLHVAMAQVNALAAMSDEQLVHSPVGYQIADTYHPQRWHAHVGTQPNAVDNFESDEKLEVALRHVLAYGYPLSPLSFTGVLSLTHGAQAVSNFRPAFALLQLRKYAPDDGVVLDASTGYGGRLVGFLASSCSEYVGFDPARTTHEANERLVHDLCPPTKRVELHCLPAEDVDADMLRDSCDVALTSPPYYSKERYSDESTQSYKRYGTALDWRDGFLVPMLRLQHRALRAGGINVVNIADVKIDRQTVPLVDWTLAAARELGFDVIAVESYTLKHRWGSGDEPPASEPVIVMRKPT